MRFDRFTERAQDAATRAYEILQRYNHNQVDTEHILVALLEQHDGNLSAASRAAGIARGYLRSLMKKHGLWRDPETEAD